LEGKDIDYVFRFGDTIETTAFDWIIDPQSIAFANNLNIDEQLVPLSVVFIPHSDTEI